jgi:hypothetical protein
MLLPPKKPQAAILPTTATDDSAYEAIGLFFGKHWYFGGNLQVLSNQDGRPLYIAPVQLGTTDDITAEKSIFSMLYGLTRCGS